MSGCTSAIPSVNSITIMIMIITTSLAARMTRGPRWISLPDMFWDTGWMISFHNLNRIFSTCYASYKWAIHLVMDRSLPYTADIYVCYIKVS